MNENDILDKREQKEFNGITFSKYKKSDVKKQLLNSLINSKIEQACYWCIEYICAGHYLDLWDVILLFSGRNIHLGNPKLAQYLKLRFNNFKNIILSGYVGNELQMRNNDKIRKLFAEIITILCLSTKKTELTSIKINKGDFLMQNIPDKLKADSINYATNFFKKGDPKEIFIAINEFAFNLLYTKKTHECCYWYEWLIEFEILYKKNNKSNLIAESRYIAPVDNKQAKDVIWLIWEIILFESKKQDNKIHDIVVALMELFSIKYSSSCKKKRRFLIYNAILITTEISNIRVPLYSDENKINTVKNKINVIYKQIKKQEIKPEIEYLFNNSITGGKTNLENTIKKLDKMSEIQNVIIRK